MNQTLQRIIFLIVVFLVGLGFFLALTADVKEREDQATYCRSIGFTGLQVDSSRYSTRYFCYDETSSVEMVRVEDGSLRVLNK